MPGTPMIVEYLDRPASVVTAPGWSYQPHARKFVRTIA